MHGACHLRCQHPLPFRYAFLQKILVLNHSGAVNHPVQRSILLLNLLHQGVYRWAVGYIQLGIDRLCPLRPQLRQWLCRC
ncbi:hypothetical protein D3C74_314070 [compost metagenome]